MKILYMGVDDLSLSNGVGICELEFVNSLSDSKYGDDAVYLIPDPAVKSVPMNFRGKVLYVQGHDDHKLIPWIKSSIDYFIQGRKVLKSEKYDLVVTHLDVFPVIPFILFLWYRVPFALKTLGFGSVYAPKRKFGFMGPILNVFNEWMFKVLCRRAVAIDACTQKYVDYFSKRFELKANDILWVENATNTLQFKPMDKQQLKRDFGLEGKSPVIGFVGGTPSERGARQIVDILVALKEKHPDIAGVVVGDDPRMAEVQSYAQTMGVADRFIACGRQPYSKVPQYINTWDVGVSFDTKERIQVIGNSSQKVRQYISCGVPVVTSGGGNDFVVNNSLGSVVDESDIDSIVKEVDRWASLSEQDRASHSEKAVQYAIDNLSVASTFEQRHDYWQKRLTARGSLERVAR